MTVFEKVEARTFLPVRRRARLNIVGAGLLRAQQATTSLYLDRPLSTSEARAALGIADPATIPKWIRQGLIKAVRTGAHGHYRIPRSEIARLRGETS
jgi:excisionase family DNA binding protein